MKFTFFCLSKDKHMTTGGIYNYYKNSIKIDADEFVSLVDKNPFGLRDSAYNDFRAYVKTLIAEDSLNIKQMSALFPFFEKYIPHTKLDIRDYIQKSFGKLKEKWEEIKKRIPTFFYRDSNKVLRSHYTVDEIQKELANPTAFPNSLLSNFVKIIGFSKEDFLNAVTVGNNGFKLSLRNDITEAIETKINSEFEKFYTAEKVKLNHSIDANVISFTVKTSGGKALALSERSNGLRWYLNTFIDALSCGVSNSNVVYLFDEPGTSLHVNAQKEILGLFGDLSNKGNQVVYTTHSPYMLDTKDDGIYRIRAVDKDNQGNTHIYKTAYDSKLSDISQKDTLAPITNAIGMNFYDTFGPSKDKLNIVIEGVSDYIYIHCMSKLLGYDLSKYALIPSVGASNCVNICTILYGWGCPFFALFDYDNAGVNSGGEILRKEFLFEYEKNYCYVVPVTDEEIANKTYVSNARFIEDVVTKKELQLFDERFPCAKEVGKTLKAKLFSNAIESGEYVPSEACKENFKKLIDAIITKYR